MPSDLFRLGSRGEDVRALQRDLTACGWTLDADGIFGRRTDAAVRGFQFCRGLKDDGIAGPVTLADLSAAAAIGWQRGKPFAGPGGVVVFGGEHPELGTLPAIRGRMSSFGGPDDEGDRGYGQALIPLSATATAHELYAKYPELVSLGILRAGLTDPLPQVTCEGYVMRAGTSWCLNPDSYYLAMRWNRRPDPIVNRVAVIASDRVCVVAPTDWGPRASTGRVADLSPGAMRALGLETDDEARYLWAEDGADLGPRT